MKTILLFLLFLGCGLAQGQEVTVVTVKKKKIPELPKYDTTASAEKTPAVRLPITLSVNNINYLMPPQGDSLMRYSWRTAKLYSIGGKKSDANSYYMEMNLCKLTNAGYILSLPMSIDSTGSMRITHYRATLYRAIGGQCVSIRDNGSFSRNGFMIPLYSPLTKNKDAGVNVLLEKGDVIIFDQIRVELKNKKKKLSLKYVTMLKGC